MRLQDKSVMVIGASSGIGRELAVQLAQRGNRLLLLARRAQLLSQLVDVLPRHPLGHRCFPCDVGIPEQVQSVGERLAGEQVDVLLYNAGVSYGFNARDIDLGAFLQLMEINFFGFVSFVKYWVPRLIEQGGGVVAVNGSLAGYRGMPGAAAYSASKGALMNFIDSLRIDLGRHHIQCTLISPGFVDTPMTAVRRSPMPFMISAERAARIIIRGLERGKTEIRFPWPTAVAASLARRLPDKFYAWMMQSRRFENKASDASS